MGKLHLRDALRAAEIWTLGSPNSPATRGHSRVTARSHRQEHRWIQVKCNTVKLGLDDRCGGWSGGLGPFRMVGAFRGPFEDFAFDDSGVGALPAHRVEAPEELCDGAAPDPGQPLGVMRGEKRPGRRNGGRCAGRAMRRAATNETRSGSWPACSAVSAMSVRIA